ncbi:FAD/NAD(P)-binding protein [Rhodopila globiformis]|uniref:Ni/Fe hydrogenase subunit gamma n=1 Tax=Rhodopila globiformis TaxID=1071 RepID=A0A2S6N052_RHOGL|nr:FAD/NAD(P)-binding protein [Rhodopila globiformis]PPQ28007.1 Ni/Fe hydrogenase subunit gamma [Rhodopila globiformis]
MPAITEPLAPAEGDPMLPRIVRVGKRARDHNGTVTLTLESADEMPLPTFRPGQFTMLYVFGVGEIPVSISGDAADETCLVQTVRAVGAVSQAVTELQPGDTLGLRRPFGTAWPLEDLNGRDVVIVAGGLGLAPLRSVIYHVLANRARFGNVALLYGARNPADILFRSQLEMWRKRLDVQLDVMVDHADSSWHGRVGAVTLLLPRLAVDAARATALVCGPEVMMRFVAAGLSDTGIPDSSIWVSLERNMECAIGLCGHCQVEGLFVCKDGPVLRYDRVRRLMGVKEL